MKTVTYFKALERPVHPYPEKLGERMFSTYEKCQKAIMAIHEKYPRLFGRESYSMTIFVEKITLEIE